MYKLFLYLLRLLVTSVSVDQRTTQFLSHDINLPYILTIVFTEKMALTDAQKSAKKYEFGHVEGSFSC